MHFLIITLFLFVAADAINQDYMAKLINKIQEVGEVCSAEAKASPEDIADFISYKVPSTHEGKCMMFCFFKHFHIQQEDGSVNKEAALASLDDLKAVDSELYGKMHELYVVCSDTVKPDSDPCITAAKIGECTKQQAKVIGIDESIFSS